MPGEKRRDKGDGTYETRKSDGWVRHVVKQDNKRTVGPYRATKPQAKAARIASRAKKAREAQKKATGETLGGTIGSDIYFCLFGVYESPDGKPPKSRGPWFHEMAPTTWQHYREFYRAHINDDPIADLDTEAVTTDDLEEFRARLLAKPRGNVRSKELRAADAASGRTISPASVVRIMAPVKKAMARRKNYSYERLGKLKLPPPQKDWLSWADRDDYLAMMPRDEVRRAVLMMLHGMAIGEVCQVTHEAFDGKRLRIEEQVNEIGGVLKRRGQMKKPKRYRWIPVSEELRKELAGIEGRFVDMRPSNLRQRIRTAVKGTKFADVGPHDLRRSAAKWMLDNGAKANDVAAILGNDARTLLAWYDTADEKGKANAIESISRKPRKEPKKEAVATG